MATATTEDLRAVARRAAQSDGEHELLLTVAIDHEPAAREAWQRWRRGYSIERMGIQAMKLLPYALTRVRTLGISDPEMPRLEGIERFMWLKTEVLLEGARHAARVLWAQGISAVALKGAGVRALVGEEAIGPRAMADVDLAIGRSVTDEKFKAACRALENAGFSVKKKYAHAVTLVKDEAKVDLHRLVMGEDERFDAMDWARKSTTGEPYLVLDQTAALIVSAVHGMRSDGGLVWPFDMAAIIRTGKVNWQVVEYYAESRSLTLLIEAALHRASTTNDLLAKGRLDVHRVPPDTLERLAAIRPSHLEALEIVFMGRGERRGAQAATLLRSLRRDGELVTANGLRKHEQQKGLIWDSRWGKEWG